jgi:hypothetical protein
MTGMRTWLQPWENKTNGSLALAQWEREIHVLCCFITKSSLGAFHAG